MKRLSIALILLAALCSSSMAQESRSERIREARDQARSRVRAESSERRYPNRRRVEVKDPADFAKLQKKPIFSGPQPGETLPPVKATGIRGADDGQQFDAVARADGKPQILIFQDESGVGIRGLVGLSRLILQIAAEADQPIHTTSVFLDDDTARITKMIKGLAEHVPESHLLGVSSDGRDGPGAYGLNRNVSMTILLAKEGKVTHNFAFPQSMLYPDPHVIGAIAELIGQRRETVAAWLNQKGPNEKGSEDEGQAMSGRSRDVAARQAAFRQRLGELVEAGKLTRDEAGGLYRIAFPEE